MSDKKELQPNAETLDRTNHDAQAKQVAAGAVKTETVVVKKGGGGLAFLALLVACAVGGAGYYFGRQEVNKINEKIIAVENRLNADGTPVAAQTAADTGMREQEAGELAALAASVKAGDDKISALEAGASNQDKALSALKAQVEKLGDNSTAQPNDWLLSEADFLLSNALRKLVLDNDVDTSISLLKISDEVLAKVSDPAANTVRTAINQDLKQLLSLNRVDQNAIMQRLSQLANNVDELMALNVNFDDAQTTKGNENVTDDVSDWKSNLEKTATSFMNHFVRITPRSDNANQALLAPNQDIYLRENIRLRLQIAILAVPRQQNELYKQSLETVAAWVRTYFDTNNEIAANFLNTVDELADQSIYIDVPDQLDSLTALDKLLDKRPQEVRKVAISADKGLTEANQAAAQEMKADEPAAGDAADNPATTGPAAPNTPNAEQ